MPGASEEEAKAAMRRQPTISVRFELPWSVWCNRCEGLAVKGSRATATKDHVGFYYTTPVFTFTFPCPLCFDKAAPMVLATDPKHRDFAVITGGRRKAEPTRPPPLPRLETDPHASAIASLEARLLGEPDAEAAVHDYDALEAALARSQVLHRDALGGPLAAARTAARSRRHATEAARREAEAHLCPASVRLATPAPADAAAARAAIRRRILAKRRRDSAELDSEPILTPPPPPSKKLASLRSDMTVRKPSARSAASAVASAKSHIGTRSGAKEKRSVYVAPLRQSITTDELYQAVTEETGAVVLSVKLNRRAQSKAFAGSAYVEFASHRDAQALVKSNWVYDGVALDLALRSKHEKLKERAQVAKSKQRAKETKKKRRTADTDANYI
ncbi:uncharacterized protein AMSG_05641 [Thecamonas trahens ATCC 50062]|uniref:RRM domain-containing protein n=1 Tax=Thecamonas trahens ATCC 50062 TaxID=461836 RepID=A0A0L0DC05_THETB|nr:hypothetical protein AMSG_05641 [Thecamonas trahens ATCC 50062]KNC49601.1 hypothetical protein AMSG_05641 [Thecamonas trahens ATCC 50062]|eukprot:XP_013757709.1 hypothetical protein AMSG_05641 [Thecamonas trahens ATCC 50062]